MNKPTEEFIDKLEHLKAHHQISYQASGRKIGLNSDKIINIRLGRSSATAVMVEQLEAAFPELNQKTTEQRLSILEHQIQQIMENEKRIQEEIERLTKENEALRKEVKTNLKKNKEKTAD